MAPAEFHLSHSLWHSLVIEVLKDAKEKKIDLNQLLPLECRLLLFRYAQTLAALERCFLNKADCTSSINFFKFS